MRLAGFGARDGTRTHTAKPHAPQTCLSTIPTLSQMFLCIIPLIRGFVNMKIRLKLVDFFVNSICYANTYFYFLYGYGFF